MFVSDAPDGLRKVGFGLAQDLRMSDFGPDLLNGLLGQIHRFRNGLIEGQWLQVRHEHGLTAKFGPS